MKQEQAALKHGWRSGFEQRIADELTEAGVDYKYEELKIEWNDCKTRRYTPDFVLHNGIIVETKGRFTVQDRMKHLEIQKQHPSLDIRFVFYRANIKLNKKSKTSYGQWATRHGFQWAEKHIPVEWLEEE
jgi:hypothetical protein